MPVSSRPRRRVLVALAAAAVIGAVGGGAVAVARPVTWTATGTVFVSASDARSVADLTQQQPTFVQEVRTSYAGVATTPIVLQPVIDGLHLHTSVASLAKRVSVSASAETALLDIAVTDPSASRAVAIANAVQDRLVDVSSSLTPTTATADRSVALRVVRSATSAPSGPSASLVVLAGALAGVLVWAVALVITTIRRMPPRPPGRAAPSML